MQHLVVGALRSGCAAATVVTRTLSDGACQFRRDSAGAIVGLVHDDAPIDAEEDAPRRGALLGRQIRLQREVEKGDVGAGGLAAGRGERHRGGPILWVLLGVEPFTPSKVIQQPRLPRKRVEAVQRLEYRCEIAGPQRR